MSGALIVLEGPDGVGKTSITQAVSERLNAMSVPYIVIREPGGTSFAEGQRQLLLHSDEPPATTAEIFAFLAAKADLLEKVIYPALRAGTHVLCDRFTRSLLAYQGGLRGYGYLDLMRLLAHGQLLVMPHLEFCLTTDPEERTRRRAQRKGTDLIEEAAAQHAAQLAQGYVDADNYLFAHRTITLDTTVPSIEDLANTVTHEIQRYLKFHEITQPTIAPLSFQEWETWQIEREHEARFAETLESKDPLPSV